MQNVVVYVCLYGAPSDNINGQLESLFLIRKSLLTIDKHHGNVVLRCQGFIHPNQYHLKIEGKNL